LWFGLDIGGFGGHFGPVVEVVGMIGVRFVEPKCSSLVVVRVVELVRCGVAVCFAEVLRDEVV
jgi:hypothetical protein